ncbi:hypothetical protein AHiyo1_41370 [Arthrobacter sp. Hiyo1]|nr:hypothetical protein AHiyo1_41370 [Arthrobacter sp. Hiyo1]
MVLPVRPGTGRAKGRPGMRWAGPGRRQERGTRPASERTGLLRGVLARLRRVRACRRIGASRVGRRGACGRNVLTHWIPFKGVRLWAHGIRDVMALAWPRGPDRSDGLAVRASLRPCVRGHLACSFFASPKKALRSGVIAVPQRLHTS